MEADVQICHCMVFDYLPTDMTKLRMHQPGRRFNHLDAKVSLLCNEMRVTLRKLARQQIIDVDEESFENDLGSCGPAREIGRSVSFVIFCSFGSPGAHSHCSFSFTFHGM